MGNDESAVFKHAQTVTVAAGGKFGLAYEGNRFRPVRLARV